MKLRTKSGFALASTLAIMVVFLTLSGLVFTLATLQNDVAKKEKEKVYLRSETMQIVQNFCDYDLTEFKNVLLENYTFVELNDVEIYEQEKIKIELYENNQIYDLKIKINKKIVADVEKGNEIIYKKIYI